MADEDALKELKERLAKTDIGMAGGARKTRSSAKPLDAAPDTFMGASVGAKAEEIELPAVPEAEAEGGERRRRAPARRRPRADLPSDLPAAFSGMLAEEAEEHTEVAEVKEVPPTPIPVVETKPEETKPPVTPKEPAINPLEAELTKVKAELATERNKHHDTQESLDEYNMLCENLSEGKQVGVRTLAQYIGEMMEENEELTKLKGEQGEPGKEVAGLKEEIVVLKEKLVEGEKRYQDALDQLAESKNTVSEDEEKIKGLQAKVDTLKKDLEDKEMAFVALQQAQSTNAEVKDGESNAADKEAITALQAEIKEKDDEIADLKVRLATVSKPHTINLSNADLPDDLKDIDLNDEEAIIAMAERELGMMETLIKEQEAYLKKMQEEMKITDEELSRMGINVNSEDTGSAMGDPKITEVIEEEEGKEDDEDSEEAAPVQV